MYHRLKKFRKEVEEQISMRADPILLQKKYDRIIKEFARQEVLSLDKASEFFYHSEVYQLMREGISYMHCMSDGYLAEDLTMEYDQKPNNN